MQFFKKVLYGTSFIIWYFIFQNRQETENPEYGQKTYPRVIGELRYVKRNFEVNLKRVETDKKVIISSFPYQPYTIAIRLLEAYLWVWIVKRF